MDFLRESFERFTTCCEDICMACQKWCERCFDTYANLYENKEDLISVAVEWEFISGIKKILRHSRVDANKIDEFTHISLFEKVCMTGNEECVRTFLEYSETNNLPTIGDIGISMLISKPSILSIIQSFLDAPEMKEPDVE
jgi:hypothetical protein